MSKTPTQEQTPRQTESGRSGGWTPGPWRYQAEALYRGQRVAGRGPSVWASPTGLVARLPHGREANARLIALAPQLYEALRALVTHTVRLDKTIEDVACDGTVTTEAENTIHGLFTTARALLAQGDQ